MIVVAVSLAAFCAKFAQFVRMEKVAFCSKFTTWVEFTSFRRVMIVLMLVACLFHLKVQYFFIKVCRLVLHIFSLLHH